MKKSLSVFFVITILLSVFAFCARAEDDPLAKLIPEDKWFDLGLFKLSTQERKDLAREINRLSRHGDHGRHGRGVAVIAPSMTTEKLADEVLKHEGLREVSFRDADEILVVVGSAAPDPLDREYDTACELIEDADRQFNLVGPDFHIYFYSLEDDFSVELESHKVVE